MKRTVSSIVPPCRDKSGSYIIQTLDWHKEKQIAFLDHIKFYS